MTAVEADFADLPFRDAPSTARLRSTPSSTFRTTSCPAVFTEIRRVLTRGAPLLIVVWGGERHEGTFDHEWLNPPRYFSFYTHDQARALDTPGFTMEDFTTFAVDESDMDVQVITLRAE